MQKSLVSLFMSAVCLFAQADALARYAQEGERALAEHRYSDAEQAFEKLRQLTPGTAEVHARLGVIYFQERKFEQAIPALRQALKLKPTLPNVDVLLALSLAELGHYSEALPALERGFRHTTDAAIKRTSGLQLERVYTGLGRDRQAVEVALELSRLYPDDAEVLYHSGQLFGNFAYQAMRKLADVAPNSIWRHQAAGEAFQSQGDYGRAEEEYRKVLALDPHRSGIHFRLGRVLQLRAQPADSQAEVVREFERELEVDATNANAAYELAEIHRRAGEYNKAREFLEVALKHYPDFEEAQVGMGAVLIALEKPEAALPYLRRAIALDGTDDVPYYHLSQAYRKLGNSIEAQRAAAEFRRLRQRTMQQQETRDIAPRREVTQQQVDEKIAP